MNKISLFTLYCKDKLNMKFIFSAELLAFFIFFSLYIGKKGGKIKIVQEV